MQGSLEYQKFVPPFYPVLCSKVTSSRETSLPILVSPYLFTFCDFFVVLTINFHLLSLLLEYMPHEGKSCICLLFMAVHLQCLGQHPEHSKHLRISVAFSFLKYYLLPANFSLYEEHHLGNSCPENHTPTQGSTMLSSCWLCWVRIDLCLYIYSNKQ